MNRTRKQRDIKKYSPKTARRRREERTLQKRKTRKMKDAQTRRARRGIINNIQNTLNFIHKTLQDYVKPSSVYVRPKQYSITPPYDTYKNFHNTILDKYGVIDENLIHFDKDKLTEEYLNINNFTPVYLLTHGEYPKYGYKSNIPGNNNFKNMLTNVYDAFVVVPRDVVIVDYVPIGRLLNVKEELTEELTPYFMSYVFNDIIRGRIINTPKGRIFMKQKIEEFLNEEYVIEIIKEIAESSDKTEDILVNRFKENMFNLYLTVIIPSLRIYTEGNLYFNISLSLEGTIKEYINHSKKLNCNKQIMNYKNKTYRWNKYGTDDFKILYKSKLTDSFVIHPDIDKYFTYNSNIQFNFYDEDNRLKLECPNQNDMFLSELIHYGFLNDRMKSRDDFTPENKNKYIFFVHSCRGTPNFTSWPSDKRKLYATIFDKVYNLGKYQTQLVRSPYMMRDRITNYGPSGFIGIEGPKNTNKGDVDYLYGDLSMLSRLTRKK